MLKALTRSILGLGSSRRTVRTGWSGAAPRRTGAPMTEEAGTLDLRRWNGARTTRLNSAHWAKATKNTINADLVADRDTLVFRSRYEIANNGYISGMIDTNVIDTIGEGGPTLEVQSEDKAFNDWVEALWRRFWSMPDVNRELTGNDLLDQWIRSEWSDGEFLSQIVRDTAGDAHPWGKALLNIDPSRLKSDFSQVGQLDLILGVKRNKTGRPISYTIEDIGDEGAMLSSTGLRFQQIDASHIIHEFQRLEAGQARGVPRLAPGLDVAADLRDFEGEVMIAARYAARTPVYFVAKTPDGEYIDLDETEESEPGVNKALAPGWDAKQMTPQQPAATYDSFHDSKLRELGRLVNMPLMMVKLDSQKHNYSSARFDAQLYFRGIKRHRQRIARRVLVRLLSMMVDDCLIDSAANPDGITRPAGRIDFLFTWPPMPNVDPVKEAQAELLRLTSGQTTLIEVLAAQGKDIESHVLSQARVVKAYEEAGLPMPEWGLNAVALAQQIDHEEKANRDDEARDNEDDDDPALRSMLNGALRGSAPRGCTNLERVNRHLATVDAASLKQRAANRSGDCFEFRSARRVRRP